MTSRLILLGALVVILYSFPGAKGSVQAQETTEVQGQVVNGTQGADLRDDLSVVMLITGVDGRLAGTGQAKPDAQGRFVFEDVQVLPGGSYTISIDHLGVFYGASLAADNLADELSLTVYETTKDASIIQVERQVMVVAAVDRDDRLVSAIEFVRLSNPTDRTLLPDLTNLEQISFLRFALPPDAAELTVQSDLPGGDIASIGTGFALTSPVFPGSHSIDFSYTFPYDDDTLSYRQSLVQGAGIFQVLMPDTIPDMAVPVLNRIGPVNIEGTTYRAYEGRDFSPGQGLQLEITGLPLPGVWSRFSNSVTSGAFWQIAIPVALGVTLAATLLWGLLQGNRRGTGEVAATVPTKPMEATKRATVIQSVAALDEQFQQGTLPETDYHEQRQGLITRVLDPEAAQHGESEEDRPQ